MRRFEDLPTHGASPRKSRLICGSCIAPDALALHLAGTRQVSRARAISRILGRLTWFYLVSVFGRSQTLVANATELAAIKESVQEDDGRP